MSTATYAQLTAEIASNWPSGNPTTLTAASARRYLQDQIDSLNVAASVASAVNLSKYQPFVNTASASSGTAVLSVYDGTAEADWAVLNTTSHTIALIPTGSITSSTGISSGSAISAVNTISGGAIASFTTLAGQDSTATSSVASQVVQMGTTANLGIFWCGSVPSVSTAAQGSLCLSTGGAGVSTRAYIMGSAGTWIAITTVA